MVISRPLKLAFEYVLAAAIPLVIGLACSTATRNVKAVLAYVFFLCIAIFARFLGFGPAIVSAFVSAWMLWQFVFLNAWPVHPVRVDLFRVAIFLAASIVVAGLSRQRSNEAREAEKRSRSLVDLSPYGVSVIDERGVCTFVNETLIRMLGAASANEVVEKPAHHFVHPSFREGMADRVAQLTGGDRVPWEKGKLMRLDGTSLDVEIAGVPIREGGRFMAHTFVRDITEQERTAAALEENRRRMQGLFEGAIDAIIFIDADGHYIDANPAACELLGRTREEILSLKVGEVAAPEDKSAVPETWRKLRSGGRVFGESRIGQPSGNVRAVEYQGLGNILPGLHVVAMHDITGRKEAERALQRLSGELLRLQEEERKRIARELHDEIGQVLTSASMMLTLSQKLPQDAAQVQIAEARSLLEDLIGRVRSLALDLRPSILDHFGLTAALSCFFERYTAQTGIRVVAKDLVSESQRFSAEIETAAYRIVQEALTNVARHAEVVEAAVSISMDRGMLVMEIEDRGIGFDRQRVSQSIGLTGMRERANILGGQLIIETSPGAGTRIIAELPL